MTVPPLSPRPVLPNQVERARLILEDIADKPSAATVELLIDTAGRGKPLTSLLMDLRLGTPIALQARIADVVVIFTAEGIEPTYPNLQLIRGTVTGWTHAPGLLHDDR